MSAKNSESHTPHVEDFFPNFNVCEISFNSLFSNSFWYLKSQNWLSNVNEFSVLEISVFFNNLLVIVSVY